ncbi:hypothetical protein P7K49_035092 [Saguinus oedipus]|uniref:Uncharacterized protein n=1 Tax=Saguinus oedipus TaxID=9490 RepID=A0ABQ9TXH8_SAGOE|nr:hypothetical protein P7K49_035092 [Saguinus oedipus]
MTFVPVMSLQRQSHLDDAISNSKASFDFIPMGKIFSPCVFAAEKVPLSYDVIIADKAIFLGHTTGENASLIVYSPDIRPAFHSIVTGTLPPSCDAITREGALPYDVIRGTVPLPVMSSPEMTTHSGTSPGGGPFCDATRRCLHCCHRVVEGRAGPESRTTPGKMPESREGPCPRISSEGSTAAEPPMWRVSSRDDGLCRLLAVISLPPGL